MEEGGGSAGVKDPTEEGGGPAGVVDGLEGRPFGDLAKILVARWPEPGVKGAWGLEESGSVQDILLFKWMITLVSVPTAKKSV